MEMVGRALKGLIVLAGRFLSVLGFSSISETAFLGAGGGGEGSDAGAVAAAFPRLLGEGAVIARGAVLLGAGAAEDSAAGFEGVERGGLVAIQSDVRERKGGWVEKWCGKCQETNRGLPKP